MYADMTSVQYIHSTRAERRFGRAPVGICVVQALQRARAKCRMALSGADSPGESPEAFGAPAFAWGKYTPFSFVERTHHPRAMIVDLLAALTHVTSEKSRRPVP